MVSRGKLFGPKILCSMSTWACFIMTTEKKNIFFQEDEILTKMVAKHGENWQTVASAIPGREAKQCRIR